MHVILRFRYRNASCHHGNLLQGLLENMEPLLFCTFNPHILNGILTNYIVHHRKILCLRNTGDSTPLRPGRVRLYHANLFCVWVLPGIDSALPAVKLASCSLNTSTCQNSLLQLKAGQNGPGSQWQHIKIVFYLFIKNCSSKQLHTWHCTSLGPE